MKFIRPAVMLAWLRVITAGAFAKPHGRIEREADALDRLEIWARDMITAKEGWLTARTLRYAAGVESRSGAVLKALFWGGTNIRAVGAVFMKKKMKFFDT